MQTTLPDTYLDRTPAFIKHSLLKSYLQKLFLIIGTAAKDGSAEVCYVDCFAGPWEDDSDDLHGTSISVSLQMLEECRDALVKRGIRVTMRALYIEKDRSAFDRLEKYLARATPAGVESKCLRGNFVSLRQDILQWAGNEAFTFFFIDPKGYKEVGIEVLRPLLERPRSEFLINFMYNFLNRSVSLPALQELMRDLLGGEVDIEGLSPRERERLILDTYRRNLKRCVPSKNIKYPPRSGYVRVLHQKNDRPWYHLVYVTSHPRGLVAFMTISHSLDLVQKQVRADHKEALREASSGISDLFSDQAIAVTPTDAVSSQSVDQYWIDYLKGGGRRVDTSVFADILESTNWFPEDLQGSLNRLIAVGKVRNLDAGRSRRPKYPLHFDTTDGERLELI